MNTGSQVTEGSFRDGILAVCYVKHPNLAWF